jgi:hypothetical protein
MNEAAIARPPVWFRVAAILALLWELFGVATYLMHVGVLPAQEMSEIERNLAASMPVWATAAYAVAVFAGALGALVLLLGKRWSRPLLILSLVGIVIQFAWWLLLSGAMTAIGPSVAVMPAVIFLIGLALVWLANNGIRKGWLA